MQEGHIGVDESGKGDYFGPLVIAACYVGPEHYAELDGVMDSKKLTDKTALALAQRIKATCPCSVIAIGPAKYNELHAKMRNLNRILEWGHAQAIENVLKLQPSRLAISDQFANPAGLLRMLASKKIEIELQSKVRAEADIAVAAASILARAEFLNRLAALGNQFGMTLPKGATSVKDPARRFLATHGREALGQVAKLHFKTTNEL